MHITNTINSNRENVDKTKMCFIVMLFLFLLGFLYMNSFTHPRLNYTFTNYLAPLMANFDTIGNYSDILHKDDGMFTQWFNLKQWLYEMNVYVICMILTWPPSFALLANQRLSIRYNLISTCAGECDRLFYWRINCNPNTVDRGRSIIRVE